MLGYVLKRVLLMIPVVVGVIVLVFSILYITPGDPVRLILDATASEADILAKRVELGLSDPFLVQLVRYIVNLVVRFDFGESYITRRAIGADLLMRFPLTVNIAVICMVMTILVGTPLGIIAALNQGKLGDTLSMLVALIGVSMPAFWAGLLLVLFFSVRLGWLPAFGMGGLEYYILPCITTSLVGIATLARQTRSSMLEVMRSDFITTAKAKGLSKRKIIMKHMLPNALIPIITVAGNTFSRLLGGVVVTEVVFSITGLGAFMITGINQRDYPVVLGCVVWMAVAFSIVMLIVDLCYAFVDPRIKAQYAKKGWRRKHA